MLEVWRSTGSMGGWWGKFLKIFIDYFTQLLIGMEFQLRKTLLQINKGMGDDEFDKKRQET